MASHNTKFDAANTAVRAFLTEIGGFYRGGRQFNLKSPEGIRVWEDIRDNVFGGKCCYCGRSDVSLQTEHLIMFNREECGLHHPGNLAPCCKNCNKRLKSNGETLSWREHLEKVSGDTDSHDRIEKIMKHMKEGKYKYPDLSSEEVTAIKLIANSLYSNIVGESDKSVKLYIKLDEAFVHKLKKKL